MNPLRLILRNILGSPFRSALVVVCVALVAGSSAWSAFIITGAQSLLRLSVTDMQYPGVDLVVIPRAGGGSGTSAANIDLSALLAKLEVVPGVRQASPQQNLASLADCPTCAGHELFVVAFDPATDFIIRSQLADFGGASLGIWEAYVGSLISSPPGQEVLDLAGFPLKLVGRLQPTGTSQDYSLYISFETARDLTRHAKSAGSNLVLSGDHVPVILVSVSGSQARVVAQRILKAIPGVTVFDQAAFFEAGHAQLAATLRSIPGVLGITWFLSSVFIGMIFMIAINERRREIGLLRALGSTRKSVLSLLLAQGALLALAGNAAGLLPGLLAGTVFRQAIINFSGLPLASPSPAGMIAMVLGSLALTLVSVSLAVLFPAWRINRRELAAVLTR